jgi:hypothetical protein
VTTEGKATTLAFGYTDLRLDVVRPADLLHRAGAEP